MIWLVIVALLIAFYLYIEFTPKDVDPDFLKSQASVSSTRVTGESAVYRSLVNDHGHELLGSSLPICRFTLSHLWKDLDKFKMTHVNQTGFLHEITDFKRIVVEIQELISSLEPGSRVPISFGASVEGLAAFLAITLSGRVPVLLKAHTHGLNHNRNNDEKDSETSEDEDPHPIVSEREFEFGKGSTGVKISVPGKDTVIVPLLLKNNDQMSASRPAGKEKDGIYVTDLKDNIAVVSNNTEIKEVDLGVSIAAQLTAMGTQYRWNSKDTVFMAPGSMTLNSIVMMLTALSSGASLLFAETCPTLSAATILDKAKPTIMVSDDVTMRTLSKISDDFRVFEWARYLVLRLRLAKGKLGPNAMVPGFKSLRLVHTATGPDPFQWLSNGEVASLRVLTGTQIVHTYTPDAGLPVSQTLIGDYRSQKLPGVNMGPPLPGLEIKKRGGNSLLVRRATHDDFVPVSTACSEGAKLGNDGCLYIPEKRHDFSNYYYYTGELK